MIRLSAIIPAYNCAPFLGAAIASALAQEGAQVEVIVVDDGSTDDTPAVLASFGDRIRTIRQENRGLPAARNAGIAASRGEAIGFLDADDTWEPQKTLRQLEYLDANPDCSLVFSDVFRMDESGRRIGSILGSKVHELPRGRCLAELFLGNFVLVPAVVVRRAALERAGPFDESLRSVEDYDMWLRIAETGSIGVVPEPLASWRERAGQMSRNRARMLECEVLVLERALERNPALAEALGRRARRRFARLYDENGWLELQDRNLRAALRCFAAALGRDPLWTKPYLHLVATVFAAAGWRGRRVGLRRSRSDSDGDGGAGVGRAGGASG